MTKRVWNRRKSLSFVWPLTTRLTAYFQLLWFQVWKYWQVMDPLVLSIIYRPRLVHATLRYERIFYAWSSKQGRSQIKMAPGSCLLRAGVFVLEEQCITVFSIEFPQIHRGRRTPITKGSSAPAQNSSYSLIARSNASLDSSGFLAQRFWSWFCKLTLFDTVISGQSITIH